MKATTSSTARSGIRSAPWGTSPRRSTRRRPHFFKSDRARKWPDRDFHLADIARATSAAPTYFEPAQIRSRAGGDPVALVDGGAFANNPAGKRSRYLRIQAPLHEGNDDMDDASRTNLEVLKLLAKDLIATHSDAIDEMVERLRPASRVAARAS